MAAFGSGVALLSLAAAIVSLTRDLEIWSILATILGGWALGAAFVAAMERLGAAGLVLHVVVAIAAGAAGTTIGSWPTPPGDRVLAAIVVVGGIALAPAAGWVWLTLFGGLLGRVRVGRRPTDPPSLEWRAAPTGGAVVEVRAVPMSARSLAGMIALATVAAAIPVMVVLIGFSDVVARWGPRAFVVLVALPFAGLVYLCLRVYVGSRSVSYTIVFGSADVAVASADREERFAYREIELLRWRERGEFARLEVRTAMRHRTLLIGLTRGPALPPLSRRSVGLLEAEGLRVQISRDRQLTTYRR